MKATISLPIELIIVIVIALMILLIISFMIGDTVQDTFIPETNLVLAWQTACLEWQRNSCSESQFNSISYDDITIEKICEKYYAYAEKDVDPLQFCQEKCCGIVIG